MSDTGSSEPLVFCFSTNYLKSLRRWMNRLGMVRESGVDFNIKMTSSSYVIYIYLLGTRIYIIPFFLLTIHGQHLENDYYRHQITSKWQRCLDVTFIDKNKEYHSTAGLGQFHTHFRVCFILIVEDPTVIVKCRKVIKALFLYF